MKEKRKFFLKKKNLLLEFPKGLIFLILDASSKILIFYFLLKQLIEQRFDMKNIVDIFFLILVDNFDKLDLHQLPNRIQ